MTPNLFLTSEKDDSVVSGSFVKLIAKYGYCSEDDPLDVCADLEIIFYIAIVQVTLVAIQPIIAAVGRG